MSAKVIPITAERELRALREWVERHEARMTLMRKARQRA